MDIKRYIYSHCVSPVRVQVWDSYSQSYVMRDLPCGKCLHCTNTHVNEWCTRLFAQRKYSKYCYFVSLDYAPFKVTDSVSLQLARETAACYHNINKNQSFGMHPLVLCKNHLQDFYKRLRKNTGIKLQYFACGEYGTHADGCGYGRPHFHNIIFSNDIITNDDFVRAWTIDGYTIGRVDILDMNTIIYDTNESLKIFKYVCKYLQKSDFDFNKLATIDFHRTYFESINFLREETSDLFTRSYVCPELALKQKDDLWREYVREYSPFVVCSRRPSIGSDYLAENLERFTKQDFRLFGLQMDGLAFPRYFLRKAKEVLCDYDCIGRESEKPSSSSRLGSIVSLLSVLHSSRLSLENWSETPATTWNLYKKEVSGRNELYLETGLFSQPILCRDLSFYDRKNKFMYQFDGYHYKVWCKLKNGVYSLLDKMDIVDVLREVAPSWERFHTQWVKPLYLARVLCESDLQDYISKMFKPMGDKSAENIFREKVDHLYQEELSRRYKNKLLMQNSKLTL